MPRSFLITKLYKWNGSDVGDSDNDSPDVSGRPTGEISDDHQLRRNENSSTDQCDLTAVTGKSQDQCFQTSVEHKPDDTSEAITLPQKQTMSFASDNSDVMTAVRSCAVGSLPLYGDKSATSQRLGSHAEVLSPTIRDLRLMSNPASFPFPVHSLPPTAIAVGLRRAAIHSIPFLPADKEILNAAALSIASQQPRFNFLPWQPPLCCLFQPEVARLWRDNIQFQVPGSPLRLDRPTAVTSRRSSPVNWLLSDDIKLTSSVPPQDRKWNSTVARCPPSAAAVVERSVQRGSGNGDVTLMTSSGRAGGTACSLAAGERKLTCRHCAKPYASLGALKMHIRTHTLPCRCQLCGKAFSRPWLLQGHLRTHTGERPFACPQCGRAFADRSNLRAHLQTHAELKKYACDRCTKTFSRLSLLVKHRSGPGLCGPLAASSPWRPP